MRIDKYGPLSDIDLVLNRGFQCIYGPNESGKTLLIDALLKRCLSKKERKKMSGLLDRVDHEPKGWIVVDDGGSQTTVDETASLSQILGIPGEELRDVFVIRNSDLAMLDERRCMGRLTERILNLRTFDINAIQSRLREHGRLTDAGIALSSAGGKTSPRNQVEAAKDLIREISEYLESDSSNTTAADESRAIALQIDEERLKLEAHEIEAAEKWAALREIESAMTTASELMTAGQTLRQDSEQHILSAITRYEELEPDKPRLQRELRLLGMLSAIGALSLLLSVVLASLLNEGLFGILQSALALAFCTGAVLMWLRRSQSLHAVEDSESSLVELARSYSQTCETLKDAASGLKGIMQDARTTVARLEGQLTLLRARLRMKSQDAQTLIESAGKRVNEMRTILGAEVTREFKESDLDSAKAALQKVGNDLKDVRGQLRAHEDRLSDFEKRASSLRFEEYVGQPLGATADSIDSLAKLRERLLFFVSEMERGAQTAKTAISVFERLHAEEEEKVSELLSKGSRASGIFSSITRGSYTKVNYLASKRQIEVVDRDGLVFAPDELSRGTKDQLYLSIRVALGEKLLAGKTGFFIMDDPFLTSDLERAEKQYETIGDIVGAGWQVVLFTAREDLAKSLDKRFKTDHIKLKPLRQDTISDAS